MKKPRLQQIKYVMLKSGMIVFTSPFDMNLGAIRTKDNRSGKFNDWLFMFHHKSDGTPTGIIRKGTTDAGLFYRHNPIHPKGTAIIQHGKQYRGAFTYMQVGGHRGQEAFRQTECLDYWRDPNRDSYLDFINPESNKIYNTNGHDMGDIGNDVGKWSAGCWGSTRSIMDQFYKMARQQIKRGYGDRFTFTLLHEKEFNLIN